MKKVAISILVCLAMMLSLTLVSCGEPEKETEKVTITATFSEDFSVVVENQKMAELKNQLIKLKYSQDKICDCMPVFTLTFEDGTAYEIKWDAVDNELEGIFTEEKGQSDGTEEVQSLLAELIAEYNIPTGVVVEDQ